MASPICWLVLLASAPAQSAAEPSPLPERSVVVVMVPSGAPRPKVLQKARKALEAQLETSAALKMHKIDRRAAPKLQRLAKRCGPDATAACASEAGTISGAEVVAIGRAQTTGKTITLDVELVEAQSGAVLAAAQGLLKGGAPEELTPIVANLDTILARNALAAQLASAPAPQAPPAEEVPLAPLEPIEPIAAAPVTPAPSTPEATAEQPAAAAPAEVVADADWPVDPEDPTALHAQAQLDVVDGKIAEAKVGLRAARAKAPDDPVIAYDLAALATRHRDEQTDADVAPFLAMAPTAVLAPLQSNIRNALAPKGSTLAAGQSADLRVSQLTEAEGGALWSARAGLAVQVDSNLSVLPEDLGEQVVATKALVDAALTFAPLSGDTTANATLRLNATHVLQELDDDIAPLRDVGSGGLSARLRTKAGASTYTFEGSGSAVVVQGFGELFMVEGGLRFDWRRAAGSLSYGAFATGSMRDFRFQNIEVPDGTRRGSDRDGPRSEAGLVLGWRAKPWRLQVRAGGQWEQAQGHTQREYGPRGSVNASTKVADLDASLDLAYEWRHYFDFERDDHRITPSARVGYRFTDELSAYASVSYLINRSDRLYAYSRWLGSAGAQASW